MNQRLNPIEELAGDLFVNRQAELDLFWKWATGIPHPMRNSIALVGRRRTGKTAILVKLFNRLFHDQEAVLPVYISFARYLGRQKPIDSYEFAQEYFMGYLSSYLAFQYQRPDLLRMTPGIMNLTEFAQEVQDEYALELLEEYDESLAEPSPYELMQWVINFPRAEARIRNMPTAMIVDEFQVLTNVYNPVKQNYDDLINSFEWASETKWAPLLVSASGLSLLTGQRLGGFLGASFRYWRLEPLTREFTLELVFRLAKELHLTVDDAFAEAVWQLTGGYPYSIESLMTSFNSETKNYPDLDALQDVLVFELVNRIGQLWIHYSKQFVKYEQLLNEGQTIKKVMFWATKYPEERIDAKRVAKELDISVEAVQAALPKLNQADIVQRVGWRIYNGPGDPMLRRYIEYNYWRDYEKLSSAEAVQNWKQEFYLLRGHLEKRTQKSSRGT